MRRFLVHALCLSSFGIVAFLIGVIPAFLTHEGSHEHLRPLVYILWGPSFLIPWQYREWWSIAVANAIGYGIVLSLVFSLLSLKKKAAEPGATDNPDDAQRLRQDH